MIAVTRVIRFVGRSASAMRNNQLTLLQEVIGNGDTLIQQSTWILTKVQHQTLDVVFADLFERVFQFFARVLVKLLNVDVGDAGLQPERVVDALSRNFVADDVEDQGFVHAFPGDLNLNRSTALPFQHVGDFRCRHTVGLLVVHFENRVAGPYTGLVGGRSVKRLNDDGPAVTWRNSHSNAIIVAFLLFPQRTELFRIEEVCVGIERPGHARDGALVDRFLRRNLVGEIVLDDVQDLGETLKAGFNIIFRAGGGCVSDARAV